ncbi:MAG: DUF427 domain-containing protein [Alphaproteobacteria bacterium]
MTQQCLDRDIRITPSAGNVAVKFAGRTIADSATALELAEGNYPLRIYIPRADVDADILADSDTRTFCPFKGQASYHDVRLGSEVARDAIWFYPDPCPQVGAIKDHVAFWGDRIEIVRG